jgi:hypothetical protein
MSALAIWPQPMDESDAKIFYMRRSGVRVAAIIMSSLCFVLHVTASTVLVFVSPQEAVIAADSLANRFEGGQHSVCKIVQVSDHMLFVATGTGTVEPPLHFNPYELARISSINSHSPHEAALKYARAALEPLQQIWRVNHARYFEIGEGNGQKPKGPQAFTFIGLDQDGNISAAGSYFVEDTATPPNLRMNELQEFAGKNADDIFFYPMGVFASVPSPGVINAWIYAEKIGAPDALKRAIEAQIKATPRLVGPPISIVRLSRNGSIQWVCRGVCK